MKIHYQPFGKIIIFLVILLVFSCPDEPFKPYIHPSKSDLKKVTFTPVGYDSLLITAKDDLYLAVPAIDSLQIGYTDSNRFHLIDDIHYDLTNGSLGNKLTFSHGFKTPARFLYAPLTLRLIVDSHVIDMDTLIATFKYPYENAAPYLTEANFVTDGVDDGRWWFDDFDLQYPYFAYRYSGSRGMYLYNLETKETDLISFPSGESLVLFGDTLYLDYGNGYSYVDLVTGSHDSWVYINEGVYGLEVYNDTMYVGTEEQAIKRYTLNGEFIDIYSEQIYFRPYAISIEDNYLYTSAYLNEEIAVCHLDSLGIPGAAKWYKSPSKSQFSVKVRNGYLYYYDSDKNYVGYIHKSELEKIEFDCDKINFR